LEMKECLKRLLKKYNAFVDIDLFDLCIKKIGT
jgi:hypothetical protein